jgi:hypothetical protein
MIKQDNSPVFGEALYLARRAYFMTDGLVRIGKFNIELETRFLFFALATL